MTNLYDLYAEKNFVPNRQTVVRIEKKSAKKMDIHIVEDAQTYIA
jgi:hypothetical protein